MSGPRGAAWVLSLALLFGCGRAATVPPASGRKSVAEADVELKVKPLERTEAALVLTYEVHNRGSQVLWLFDRLTVPGPTGAPRIDPDRAYVDLSEGRAVVSRMLLPTPANLLVESPEVPGVTRLEAGQTATGRVVLPVPLRAVLPHVSEPGQATPLEGIRELRLRIGYLVEEPGLELYEARDTEGTPYKSPGYGKALKAQKVLESGKLSLPEAMPPSPR